MTAHTSSGLKISSWSHARASGSVIAWSRNSVTVGPAGPGSAAATCRGYRPFLYKQEEKAEGWGWGVEFMVMIGNVPPPNFNDACGTSSPARGRNKSDSGLKVKMEDWKNE